MANPNPPPPPASHRFALMSLPAENAIARKDVASGEKRHPAVEIRSGPPE